MRVVTEHLPGLRSAAVGFWVGTGSRDEPESVAGASHFLEHLLFKGSETRHAQEIAEAVESCGGDMNAFTGQEITAYYVRVPDRHLDLALDILSDIVWSPALRPDEVESERQVILEEIKMRDDTPDDLVHDVFAGALFPEHPLGREISGSQETISAVTRDQIAEYHAAHYRRRTWWSRSPATSTTTRSSSALRAALPAIDGARPTARSTAPTHGAPSEFARVDRPLEQSHVVLGARALRRDDPDRFALAVVDQVLGGGMSSRLFQEVREKRGLAYSVFSYRSAFEETGALAVYCATAPERVEETLDVVRAELDRLVADGGVSERELAGAKGHLTGSLALSLESSSSRMHRIGRAELTMGEIPSLDWVVEQVDAVTPDDVEPGHRPRARRRGTHARAGGSSPIRSP